MGFIGVSDILTFIGCLMVSYVLLVCLNLELWMSILFCVGLITVIFGCIWE